MTSKYCVITSRTLKHLPEVVSQNRIVLSNEADTRRLSGKLMIASTVFECFFSVLKHWLLTKEALVIREIYVMDVSTTYVSMSQSRIVLSNELLASVFLSRMTSTHNTLLPWPENTSSLTKWHVSNHRVTLTFHRLQTISRFRFPDFYRAVIRATHYQLAVVKFISTAIVPSWR